MEDIKTGVGVGSAQIFNLSGLTNMYARMMQERMVRDQKEAYAVQEMMKEYDPNKQGVRAQDIGLYNQIYQEYKNIYIKNKGLYTNPSQNVEAYNQAQKVLGEMKSIAADSKALNEFYPALLKSHLDSKGMLFDDRSVDILGKISQADVYSVKKAFNGRLPNLSDFEFKEKPIDLKKYNETLYALADKGDHTDSIVSIPHPTDKFKTLDEVKRTYSYNAISTAINQMANADRDLDKTFLKRYNYAKEFHPENIAKIQTEVRKVPGLQNFEIKDGRDYAAAYEYLNSANGVTIGKPTEKTNEAAKLKAQQAFTAGQNAMNRQNQTNIANIRTQAAAQTKKEKEEAIAQIGLESTSLYNLASQGKLTTEQLRDKFSKLTNVLGMEVALKGATTDEIETQLINYNKSAKNSNWKIPYTGSESSPKFNSKMIEHIQKNGLILFQDSNDDNKAMPIIPGYHGDAKKLATMFFDATSTQQQKSGTAIPGIDDDIMFNGQKQK